MDQTNIVAKSIIPLDYPKVQIETNEGKRYISDLSSFEKVKCFPADQKEWEKVFITAEGHNITWSCRFEVHVLQAIDAAIESEDIKLHA